MAYHPEDVGSKPTAGTYIPLPALLQKALSTRPLFTSGLDLVKTDHLTARSKLALRPFSSFLLIKNTSPFITSPFITVTTLLTLLFHVHCSRFFIPHTHLFARLDVIDYTA